MEGFLAINRGGTTFDIMNVAAFIGDDEGAFELTGLLVVDAEIALKRLLEFHAFRDVDEAAAAPASGVKGREFVIGDRDNGREVFLEDLR